FHCEYLYLYLLLLFFFSSRRRHTRSVSAFLLNRSSDLDKLCLIFKMGKVMRHTLGASLNIRHNLSSSKGPKPLQLKLLTTYIPKTSAFRSEERRVGKECRYRRSTGHR